MADVSEGAVALAKAKLQQGQPPKDRVFYARHHTAIKWTPYRPNSQEVKRGKMGRWQELRPFGIGWQNTEVVPEAGAWVEDIINRPELATRAAPPAMDREAVEATARAMCDADGLDPDEHIIGGQAAGFEDFGPLWQAEERSEGQLGLTDYARLARVALSTLSADAIRQGEGLRALSDRATPGPWSWEQCGEQEDVPVVGIAFPSDDTDCKAPYEGEFRDSDANRMTIAFDWQSCDGHSPSANAAFAVAAVNFVRKLFATPASHASDGGK